MAQRKIGQRRLPAQTAAAPAAPVRSLYVVYYWVGKDGETDIDNIVLTGLDDLGSVQKIQAVVAKIKEMHPDPDYYTKITVQNWWQVEGSANDLSKETAE